MTDRLDIVVLGLSLSSSWGNGHATTYRALLKGLHRLGHDVLFLERDTPWYAAHRDLADPPFCRFALYSSLDGLAAQHLAAIRAADAVIVGSYVPDGVAALDLALDAATGAVAFYDIDTPLTLAALTRGEPASIARRQIPRLDAYFSFAGGPILQRLERAFGAPRALPLYCSADTELYRPTGEPCRYDLGYLGTYSPDRQPALERLLIEPARRDPALRCVVAGSGYPSDIRWPANVERIDHVAPADHAAFYGRQRFTLNCTRADMKAAGWSPSVRLFEAAACGTPVISDAWPGLGEFFEPGRAILVAHRTEDVLEALAEPPARRSVLAQA
ncbi:MAG: glycosyltransferase, partial [Rhodobacteraceae bacterium]|nr:glycosyltransferase [Paracoccaceae bacterium]